MLSEAERAAYAALLHRAHLNDEITEEEVEAVLPHDLAVRAIAMMIQRNNLIIDRYDEEVWVRWRSDPMDVSDYRASLAATKKAFKAAPARLRAIKAMLAKPRNEKRGHALQVQAERQRVILASSKFACWTAYRQLSEDAKLWTVRGSDADGWPPELRQHAPIKLVLPGEELPGAFAVRHVLGRLLEDGK